MLAESALERARRLQRSSTRHALFGIPIAVKDNYFTQGVRTTANSFIYQDFVPTFDATVVTRLQQAGGIVLGKTQMGPLATTRATWLAVNADLHERVASRRVAPSAGVGAPKHAGSWPTNCLKTHWPVLG